MSDYVIAKYLRLSIEDAKTDSMSIENQRLYLDAYIAEMDINAEVTEFVDNGYSGTNFERPAVQELLEHIRAGKINCVIVKDFSRFGRNAIETGYFLERVFPLYGIRFISLSDRYDSDENAGDTGGLEVAFKFLINEQYSRDLSRKIRSAAHERMRRGERVPKNCIFGYVKTADNRLEIDERAADTVRLIFKLASEGNTIPTIGQVLYDQKRLTPAILKNRAHKVTPETGFDCVWEKSVLLKILRDEQYTGTYVAGKSITLGVGSHIQKKKPKSEWIRIPNHHPAIVPGELFGKVQAIISARGEKRKKREGGTSEQYVAVRQSPLKGKVVCGYCGHAMTLSITKNAEFHCMFSRAATDAPCYRLRVSDAELQNKLLRDIHNRFSYMPDSASVMQITGQRQEFETQIGECENAKHLLYEKYVIGELEAATYRSDKASLDCKLEYLNRVCVALVGEPAGVRQLVDKAVSENTLSRSVVEGLIKKELVFSDRETEIVWK